MAKQSKSNGNSKSGGKTASKSESKSAGKSSSKPSSSKPTSGSKTASKSASKPKSKTKDHGPSIKDDEQYEALREKGMSKEKAARISNASAKEGRSTVGRRGGKAGDYEDQTKTELMAQARKVGIAGRSNMNKSQLIKALRNH